MRIGTFFRIIRITGNYTLRKFSSLINLPHSTISALESGWLPPTITSVSSLQNYLSILSPPDSFEIISRFLNNMFLREYAFRLCTDNPFCPISWCSVGVLNAFLDQEKDAYKESTDWPGDFIRLVLPDYLIPKKHSSERDIESFLYSYIYSLMGEKFKLTPILDTDIKFKMTVLLAKNMTFIEPKNARYTCLTQPPSRVKKGWKHYLSRQQLIKHIASPVF